MEALISICLGIGLSAACGFRIFVPLLVVSLANMSGHLHLATGFEWIGTYPAMIAFAVATVAEVGGYYIPWVDHALDTIATPVAMVAGTLIMASLVTDMSPFLRWTLAVIAGGAAAGLVQGATVSARGASLVATAGFGNPIVASLELAGAVLMSLLSLAVPVLVAALILLLVYLVLRRLLRRRPEAAHANPSST
jgi:hypothetical protein